MAAFLGVDIRDFFAKYLGVQGASHRDKLETGSMAKGCDFCARPGCDGIDDGIDL